MKLQRIYAHKQTRKSYPAFVDQFDHLQDEEVVWTPYDDDNVLGRAPIGVSENCARDASLWLTRKCVLFDIVVENYCPWRVLRQFGLYQAIPPQPQRHLPAGAHK